MKVVFRKSNAAQKCSKEWRKMNMGIQLGIVGYGGMGGFHHRNASKIEGVQVVGAYDIDPVRVQVAEESGPSAARGAGRAGRRRASEPERDGL